MRFDLAHSLYGQNQSTLLPLNCVLVSLLFVLLGWIEESTALVMTGSAGFVLLGSSYFILVKDNRELVQYWSMVLIVGIAFWSGWASPLCFLLLFPIGFLGETFSFKPWGKYNFVLVAAFAASGMAAILMGFGFDHRASLLSLGLALAVIIGLMVLDLIAFFKHQQYIRRTESVSENLLHRMERVHTHFSRIMMEANTVDEVLWKVAQEVIPELELNDCVIYLADFNREVLVQKAAFGEKSPEGGHITSPLEIPFGKGVVGQVLKSGKPLLIKDTTQFPGYIADDAVRLSELSVPIIVNQKVVGVIDSEHEEPGFFNSGHLSLMQVISTLLANKLADIELSEALVDQARSKARFDQIKELETLRTSFINNLSHDLRTPLALIQGPLIELCKEDEERVQKLANVALKNARRLTEMVSSLLELHRFEQGAMEIKLVEADLNKYFQEWYSLFSHEAESRGMSYLISTTNLAQVRCDIVKIGHIVQNLLSNAFKFTPDGERIALSAAVENDKLIISVEDSGPGIPDDMHKKVFTRFFKISPDAHQAGTGIGLALVQEYVELMNGEIDLSNGASGGALFQISIPVDVSKVNEFTRSMSVPERKEQYELVLVEDHPEMREFISSILESTYSVRSYESAELATAGIAGSLPDLVITDLMLPFGMSGGDFCRQLKQDLKTDHIPVVALSAKSAVESKMELYEAGADNYLTKPFEPGELLAMVQSLIDGRKRLRERFSGTHVVETTVGKGIQRIIDLIQTRLTDPDFGPPEICSELGIGRNQLQKKLKDTTGMTPVELIRDIRLDHARRLLEEGHNVSEAAWSSGFNHLSYFGKSFKQKFGKNPSEWCNPVSK